jgi:hypothetical protein
MLARACGHAPWACACTCTRPVLAPSACTGFSGVCTMLAPCMGLHARGVLCGCVCQRAGFGVHGFIYACVCTGRVAYRIHTRHTTVVHSTYIQIHGVYEYVLCGVCAHVYGRGYVHGFFSCVHRTRPLTRVRAWAPKSHRGSARVGIARPRPREGGAHTYLARKSCTRRMCAFATACTRDEGTKKTEDATEIERVPLEGWVEVRNLYRRPR